MAEVCRVDQRAISLEGRKSGLIPISRLRSLVEGKDSIAVQTETPAALARLIASVPREKLNRAPAPGKWSLAAIVAHLAEAEIAFSWRYRQIAEKEGAALAGYDLSQLQQAEGVIAAVFYGIG